MIYQFQQNLSLVKGLGDKLSAYLGKQNLHKILDLLLALPIRYEDRSKLCLIKDWQEGELLSTLAELENITAYYKNRMLITRATIKDESGKASCFWFNNKFIKQNLKVGEKYFFSGKVGKNHTLMQASVEAVKAETLHTNRLVPIYSSTLTNSILKQGKLRRILKEILDHLAEDETIAENNTVKTVKSKTAQTEAKIEPKSEPIKNELLTISDKNLFHYLHFPDNEEQIVLARERLALEELISLIRHSWRLKKQWQNQHTPYQLKIEPPIFPKSIPFDLTQAQEKAADEILEDLSKKYPMNRILIGDVGAGKTVVAGIAAHHCLANQQNVCLVAPTKILAQQHYQTFQKIFPDLKVELIQAGGKKTKSAAGKTALTKAASAAKKTPDAAKLYIGTHAVLNQLQNIKPALVIYDEQHRFGVKQRSLAQQLQYQPHILTMTATPIPRSLMLTIFSHLQISYLNQLPPGRKKPTTWLVPQQKKTQAYEWIFQQLNQPDSLAIIICPFIDPSNSKALENVQAVKTVYENIQQQLKQFQAQLTAKQQPKKGKTDEKLGQQIPQKIQLALLHSKLKKADQEKLIDDLFQHKIQLLVATPIVEVGLDLPTANIIAIESAERFGLASLHQLRGRVGRAGQESFCLLFNSKASANSNKRLKTFTQETDGLKLAEADLKHRGAGDVFGTAQHGINNLTFANWSNVELIKQANELAKSLDSLGAENRSVLAEYFKFDLDEKNLLAN